MSFFVDNGIIIDTEYIRRKSMRQLNKLKVAITAGIILLIIIAIVALVLKLNNNTYFSKEASIDTVINNANENIRKVYKTFLVMIT